MRESTGKEKELPEEQEAEQAATRSIIASGIGLEADRIVPAKEHNGS